MPNEPRQGIEPKITAANQKSAQDEEAVNGEITKPRPLHLIDNPGVEDDAVVERDESGKNEPERIEAILARVKYLG